MTADPLVFSNSYFVQLVAQEQASILGTDDALLLDPELRQLVELYARDQARFFADFADAYRRLTWLGN
jgi:L-ascorbate peroxidase